jgi:hypothetical protein
VCILQGGVGDWHPSLHDTQCIRMDAWRISQEVMGPHVIIWGAPVGRSVMFASGPQHLHEVMAVRSGTRTALPVRYTLYVYDMWRILQGEVCV